MPTTARSTASDSARTTAHPPAAGRWLASASRSARSRAISELSDLEGIASHLAGPDPVHLVRVGDEDLPVADLAGARRLHDGFDHLLGLLVVHQDLDTHLRNEVHLVLRAAVDLLVPALAAEPPDLGDRHALDPGVLQRFLHVLQLERLDDCGDKSHRRSFRTLWAPVCTATGRSSQGALSLRPSLARLRAGHPVRMLMGAVTGGAHRHAH